MTDRPHPLHPLGVALTTLLAATLLFPWALPRETVSGLIGRWLSTERGWKRRVAAFVASWVDALVHLPLGLESCVEHYELEERARRAIYDNEVSRLRGAIETLVVDEVISAGRARELHGMTIEEQRAHWRDRCSRS